MDAATEQRGKVYLVGAGPGDPGLLTLRGCELLERAEVVIYDYLANPRLLRHAPKTAELIYVGKKGGGLHAATQEGINRLLVDHARAGKRVVRLKGGDPFIFGRGGEELEALAEAGIPFEAVPGVTAASAAATCSGIPITHRAHTASVAFITGHEDPDKPGSNLDWGKLATGVGTLAIYMGIKNLPDICRELIAAGRSPQTPAAVVRWASTSRQKTVSGTLATIADEVKSRGIKPPALILVGEVVGLRHRINWFEKRPLFGRRIVVTRTREQASELTRRLEDLGAECLECPTIAIRPLEDYSALDGALERLADFDWLLFASPNAVEHFFARLAASGRDSRALAGLKIATVGTATAEALSPYGLRADFLPEQFTGEGLARALIAAGEGGRRFLLPQAERAGRALPDLLREAGGDVTIAPAYKNIPDAESGHTLREALEAGEADCLTFASSSAARNCFELLGGVEHADNAALKALLGGTRIAAIGPQTAATVRDFGLEAHIRPQRHTIPDLAAAIVGYFGG